jgi:hypothetical protein
LIDSGYGSLVWNDITLNEHCTEKGIPAANRSLGTSLSTAGLKASPRLMEGPERLSPRAVKGSGANQAQQFMGAKWTPLDSISGAQAYDRKIRAEQSIADLKMDYRRIRRVRELRATGMCIGGAVREQESVWLLSGVICLLQLAQLAPAGVLLGFSWVRVFVVVQPKIKPVDGRLLR